MSPKVSDRTYSTEATFKREVARRLALAEINEAIWEETGGSRWRDADAERGFALHDDVNFVVTQLRHRRRKGELPPTVTITGEPRDLHMWRLRSRLTAWRLEPRAREWRRRNLPPTLPRVSVESDWIDSECGVVKAERILDWMQGLARSEDDSFVGKPLVRGGPDIRVSGGSRIYFSFPDTDAPRFVDEVGAPEEWWSASPRPDEKPDFVARLPDGPSTHVWETFEARRLVDSLKREWDWIKRGTGWSLAAATGFYLFGATPFLNPLSAQVQSGVDSAGWSKTVTMHVDFRISPDEVAQFYAAVLKGDVPSHRQRVRRTLSPAVTDLLEFVIERTMPDQWPTWEALWAAWQAQNASSQERLYSSVKSFSSVVSRAFQSLGMKVGPRSLRDELA